MWSSFKPAMLMTIVELGADASMKIFGKTNNLFLLFLGLIGYLTSGSILGWAMLQKENLGIVNAYHDGTSNILPGRMSIALGEHYSIRQFGGMILIAIGIFML